MASYPTPDLITALAPDAASLQAGRGLASPAQWALAAGDNAALWGLMQGSGKEPYQVQILADGSAVKCSCPSRKFPCKHALGLLFIAAAQPGKLAATPRPAWVQEWLATRAEKAAKAETKTASADAALQPPIDEKAQAKRREKRAGRLADGMDFLQSWLADLAKQGFADAPLASHDFWETPARRMVDASAPGLARFLRLAGTAAARGPAGHGLLMDQLGRLHLLLTAARQGERLPPALRTEVEQLIGWTVPQETVLAGPEVTDHWLVAARTVEEEDRLLTSITWLWGAASQRWAQWIQSTPARQPSLTTLPLGQWGRGGLAFYPGLAPLRAVWKTPFTACDAPAAGFPDESAAALLTRAAAALAVNPWRTQQPFCLRAVRVASGGQDWLVDPAGDALPLHATAPQTQLMTAVDGGRPVPVCGLWTGRAAIPLAMAAEHGWLSLTGGRQP